MKRTLLIVVIVWIALFLYNALYFLNNLSKIIPKQNIETQKKISKPQKFPTTNVVTFLQNVNYKSNIIKTQIKLRKNNHNPKKKFVGNVIKKSKDEFVTKLPENDYYLKAPHPPGYIEVSKIKTQPKIFDKTADLHKSFGPNFVKINNPHSPQKLRMRLNQKYSKQSELYKFVEDQDARKEKTKTYCTNKLEKSQKQPQYIFENIIVDREYGLSFCPVYKAASTTWLVQLLKLKEMWPENGTKKIAVQKLVPLAFNKVSNIAAPWMTKSTTRFAIIRHPFVRLLSCFRDKFEKASKKYYYDRYGEKMVFISRELHPGIEKNRISKLLQDVRNHIATGAPLAMKDNPYASPIGPTFQEFVKYILNWKAIQDEHWRPVVDQCSMCDVAFDFVLRFENLASDSRLFSEYLNLFNATFSPEKRNPTAGGATTSDIACKYFNQIDRDLMAQLVTKYQTDFDLLGYNPYDFWKCVKL